MAVRLKADDLVQVIAGKDKGKQGRIKQIMADGRVVVEGVAVYKHHRSPRKFRDPGLKELERPIDASNVMLVDPETEKPTRVRMQLNEDGTKTRIAVKSGKPIDA